MRLTRLTLLALGTLCLTTHADEVEDKINAALLKAADAPRVRDRLIAAGFDPNGRLSAAQRELIALAVGQTNACQYCLSAHTLIGKGAGLSEAAIRAARSGTAEGVQDKALVELAIKIVRQRGVLADSDLADAAAAGVDHGLVIEVTANVALNVLTNYTNHIADTDVDFPAVPVAL